MSATDLCLVLVLVALFLYWLDSIRAKEIATTHARQACKKVMLEFLDDTVVIKKLRLRRNTLGRIGFYRIYQFEFTSTGEHRYKGRITLLGKQLVATEMEPYQVNEMAAVEH
jgi:hypothetical protein